MRYSIVNQPHAEMEDTIFLPHATILVFSKRPDAAFCKQFLSTYFNFIVLPRLLELPLHDSRIIPVVNKIRKLAHETKGGVKR